MGICNGDHRSIRGLRFAGFLALFLPGACSDAQQVGPTPTRPPLDYAGYAARAGALHSIWDAVAYTDPATLPAGGSAAYGGVMALRAETGTGEVRLHGALQITAAFANDSITGMANGFAAQGGARYVGSLSIINGTIDRGANPATTYSFSTNLDGSLVGGGETLVITADISGDFRGTDHGALVGLVAGSAQSSFGNGYLFGDFIAGR